MTEHEALKYLKDANRKNQMVGILPKSDISKCIIKVLEEIQKYREIGKPEDLKQLKENGSFTGLELSQIAIGLMKLKEYQEIGTVEEFRAAVEKQKEMIAYCDENDCSDCPYHSGSQKENRCMNDFIADEIVKGGGVNA